MKRSQLGKRTQVHIEIDRKPHLQNRGVTLLRPLQKRSGAEFFQPVLAHVQWGGA